MRYSRIGAWLLVAVFAGAPVAPASAAIIEVTVTGGIGSGIDGAGLFGAVGSDLAGTAYSVLFEIDTSKGKVTGGPTYIGGQGPYYYSSTLSNTGGPPAVTGSLRIGGTAVFVDGSTSGVNDYNVLLHINANSLRQDVASADTELSMFDGHDPVYPVSPLGNPADGVFHDPNLNPADFFLDYSGTDYGHDLGTFNAVRAAGTTSLSLSLDTLTYIVLSAGGGPTSFVPEPATWTMLVCGFALVGTAVRRRTRLGATVSR